MVSWRFQIAQRGDPALLPKIRAALSDDQEVARFTALACVVHLSDQPARTRLANTDKP